MGDRFDGFDVRQWKGTNGYGTEWNWNGTAWIRGLRTVFVGAIMEHISMRLNTLYALKKWTSREVLIWRRCVELLLYSAPNADFEAPANYRTLHDLVKI